MLVVQCVQGSPRLPGQSSAGLSWPVASVVLGAAVVSPGREAVHLDPVWRERSDFVIAAEIASGGEARTEQLWARRINGYRFEICCIPFFVYDVALGDVVETDGDYIVRRVVVPSGRFVFRVWFGDSRVPADEIVAELQALGSLVESSSRNLLAVDAVDEAHARSVADLLHDREQQNRLAYETGRRKKGKVGPR